MGATLVVGLKLMQGTNHLPFKLSRTTSGLFANHSSFLAIEERTRQGYDRLSPYIRTRGTGAIVSLLAQTFHSMNSKIHGGFAKARGKATLMPQQSLLTTTSESDKKMPRFSRCY